MATWQTEIRQGSRLAWRDFGGSGRTVLLLHGLAGQADEWSETASWLSESFHVVAADARGHGRSERSPAEVSAAAHVADVVFIIELLATSPVILIGQSLGGITALQVAAQRSDLVQALVLVDADPAPIEESAIAEVASSLRSWPVPFATMDEAQRFFGGPSLISDAWTSGLEQRDDGYWPSFAIDVMEETLRDVSNRSFWGDWEAVQCATLIVGAEHGTMPPGAGEAMTRRNPRARFVEIPGARHDLHLDRAREWRKVLMPFLSTQG